jgi:hypothetical protein
MMSCCLCETVSMSALWEVTWFGVYGRLTGCIVIVPCSLCAAVGTDFAVPSLASTVEPDHLTA